MRHPGDDRAVCISQFERRASGMRIIEADGFQHFAGPLQIGPAFARTATAEGLLTGHPAKQQTALANGAVPPRGLTRLSA